VRVLLTGALGWFAALQLPDILVIGPQWGAAGLTASAGLAGWVEFYLLRRGLRSRVGATGLPPGLLPRLWASAVAGAGLAWVALHFLPTWHPVPTAVLVLGVYGVTYLLAARLFGVQEARDLLVRR